MSNPNPSPATRFQVGNAANPGGRPRHSAREALRDKLAKAGANPADDLGEMARTVADHLLEAALAGEDEKARAIERVIEQAEGPQKQSFDVQAEVTTRVLIRGVDDEEVVGDAP